MGEFPLLRFADVELLDLHLLVGLDDRIGQHGEHLLMVFGFAVVAQQRQEHGETQVVRDFDTGSISRANLLDFGTPVELICGRAGPHRCVGATRTATS